MIRCINNHAITNKVMVNDTLIIKDIPSTYHYTSVDGLKSIFKNKTLRFTNARYMNDYNEVLDGLDVIRRYLDSNENISSYFDEFFSVFEKNPAFVFCMSLGKDELPLWNYYSKSNTSDGYNIEFDYGKLLKAIIDINANILNDCEVSFGKVIYNDKLKSSIIENYSKELANGFEKFFAKGIAKIIAKKQNKTVQEVMHEIEASESNYHISDEYQVFKFNNNTGIFDRNIFLDSVYFSKHKAFEFEHEIRIVISIPSERFASLQKSGIIQYRTFNGNFIPYIDLNFNLDCINGINIGPMRKSDMAKKGLESFLSSLGVICENKENNIKIEQSTIPIRY